MAINVLVLLNQPEPIKSRYAPPLAAAFPQLSFTSELEAADVLLTQGSAMSDELLRRARRLRWIHAVTSGTDGIDDLPSLRPEVLLTSTRGIHGAPVSEAALMAMLALSRNFALTLSNQAKGLWHRPPVTLLDGKTVGIFGVGMIGSALAPRCKALGMRVIGVDLLLPRAAGVDRMVAWEEGLAELPGLDYVVLLIPLSKETRGIVDAQFFAAMKPTSYLINLARGGVLDEAALVQALREGRIAGAALDTFGREPLPPEHPLWTMPNVIVTPHLGGLFDEYAARALPIVMENMRRFLAGDYENMLNRVSH